MPRIKVIFLDIDGVLNGGFQKEMTNNFFNLDKEKIKLLNRIIRESSTQDIQTKIVLSSTWRLDYTEHEIDFHGHAIDMFFEAVGIIPVCLGRTRYLSTDRGKEILSWLVHQQLVGKDQVESICILDDDNDMLMMEPWLVQTNHRFGITEQTVIDAVKMLDKPFKLSIHLE